MAEFKFPEGMEKQFNSILSNTIAQATALQAAQKQNNDTKAKVWGCEEFSTIQEVVAFLKGGLFENIQPIIFDKKIIIIFSRS